MTHGPWPRVSAPIRQLQLGSSLPPAPGGVGGAGVTQPPGGQASGPASSTRKPASGMKPVGGAVAWAGGGTGAT